jgi:hypothetical protein
MNYRLGKYRPNTLETCDKAGLPTVLISPVRESVKEISDGAREMVVGIWKWNGTKGGFQTVLFSMAFNQLFRGEGFHFRVSVMD